MCVFVNLCVAHVYRIPWRPEESIGSPRIGVTGSCEPPLGSRSQVWVLCKGSKCSQLLSHLSSIPLPLSEQNKTKSPLLLHSPGLPSHGPLLYGLETGIPQGAIIAKQPNKINPVGAAQFSVLSDRNGQIHDGREFSVDEDHF